MQRIAANRLINRRAPAPAFRRPAGPGLFGSIPALLLALAAGAFAQAKRCDLVGRDTTTSPPNPLSFKRCLDLTALDGRTVNVPLNVTRIDNDGLSLCKSSVQSGGNADIVYVYDNSGSMRATVAYVDTVRRDTTYYYNTGGCGSSTSGTVSYYRWNDDGTNQVLQTVARIGSSAGCFNLAGDPYNTRARAFYLGINEQADRAPQSTAGIIGFESNTEPVVRSRVLNSTANRNAVLAGINTAFDGGTSYGPPMVLARNWLTDPAITSNSKKAIIFLSDGRPTDGYTAPASGSNHPPIYGIFLGRPRSDTLILHNMSVNTGGRFYLIPPDDPDSLRSVVAAILNIVLLEYNPQTATVTNTSLSPAQSATSSQSDFILQPDGSWLMRLSDIIGLRRNAANAITFTTTFRERNGTATDTRTIGFTISTTLPEIGSSQRIGTTQFGGTCYDRSTLSILNAAGARPAFFTDTNTVYQVRIRTAPAPLDSAMASSLSGVKADAESPRLRPPQVSADSLLFRNPFSFQAAAGSARTAGNGILESSLYDSIIVAWTHPRDAQDFVADTMRVRAQGQVAQIWFSQTNDGAPTAQFPSNATVVYIVVRDQVPDPRRTYTAVITSDVSGLDRETVALSVAASGSLVGQISISTATKTQGNGQLEVSQLGDQLHATYTDPVDGDVAQASAGFDQSVQEAPALRFTDAAGNPLAPGTVWSPANGKLYFDYSDDDVNGNIASKSIQLALAGRRYATVLSTDHERIEASFAGNLTGTRGHWKGSIDLAEGAAVDSNGKAETRYRGEAAITATAHDNAGAAQSQTVSDFLVIAYPDSQASIQWKLDSSVTANEGLIITVNDQTFTLNQKDTVLVSVACTRSGDSVSAIPAGEGPTAASGTYTGGTVTKDEGTPNLGDRNLSCLTTDQIRIRYVDPVYGTLTELLVDEVAKPVATPAGRRFVTSELVTLASSTPGATIWYTVDGTTPVPGKSLVYSDPIRIPNTTILKAVAVKPGFKDSKVMTETYTKEFVASRLEILDENGNAIPNGIITGSSKSLRIKLVTTQDNLTSAEAPASVKVSGDAENVLLGNPASLGNAIELSATKNFKSPAAQSDFDDTLQAAGNDTLIVRWTNPYNPADVAADTVVVKPAFVAAEVYFSATENGPKITEYPVNTDTVYIVVKTRPRDPAYTYTVVLTSADGSGDRETVPLTEVSPGVFSGKAKVGTDAKAKGDNVIQVAAAGDQLTAVFTDPVYHDPYRGDAGFAQQVQESALLEFIDENGRALAPGAGWSPAKGKVYVRFSDDWNAGIDSLVQSKTVRFTLVNRKSGDSIGADAESFPIALKSHTASRGTWEGSLPLKDSSKATAGNGVLESYYRGELRAAVTPHDNAGAAVPGDATDDLVIAYPDQPAEIVIRDTSGGKVERVTGKVEIIIIDQPMTQSGPSNVTATVSCSQSGDKVEKVVLVWDGKQYVSQPPLDKGETNSPATPNKNDGILQCREGDVLIVTYIDPVYGNPPRSNEVSWNDDRPAEMWYASAKDGSRIASANDGTDSAFIIVVKGMSPTRDKADTILVSLAIGSNEKETYRAVETGPYTGEFRATVPFRFQTAAPDSQNGKLEAPLDVAARINQAVVKGEALVGSRKAMADLTLLSVFDLASSGWAKDENGDGRVDHLYFRFDHALAALPDGLPEAYWNEGAAAFRQKASAAQISFVKGDSTLIVADFSKSPFGEGLTGIPDKRSAPYALFPEDKLYGGQKRTLADSVGPIPVKAVKHPSDGKTYAVTNTEWRFNPDTLYITVSERLGSNTTFSSLFRFSKGCQDYSESVPLKLFSLPELLSDGLQYRVIVDNSLEALSPLVHDCIFLETDGRYTDIPGNLPSKVGAPIEGGDPKLIIRGLKGYPPVAGIDAGSPGFTAANQDRLDERTFRQQTGAGTQVIWIPPAGFDPKDPMGSVEDVARDFNDPTAGDRSGERTGLQAMPPGLSTVRIITLSPYLVHVNIFDNLGNFVRSTTQSFGHNGELRNRLRITDGGLASFIVWDMKDSKGLPVGQGVYVWKMSFTFEDKTKKAEVRYTRTGVMRPK